VTPLVLTTSARHFAAVPRYWKEFVALGLFAALTTLSQGKAYTLTLSSYVEAVKQIEILYAMAIGVVAFGEGQRVRESALGAVVMLLGLVLLALATVRAATGLDLRALAVRHPDLGRDAAPHVEVTRDLEPARPGDRDEVVQD